MNKSEIRALAKKNSADIDAAEIAERGKSFLNGLLKNKQYMEANTVFCYISVGNEASTMKILDDAIERGKRVCVPVCISATEMIARRYLGVAGLFEDKYGIPIPPPNAGDIPENQIDFAIVPCVACGKDFSRLGHGAGFYDRFLPKTNCPRIALCHSENLFETVPTAEHDLAMNGIITEKACFYAEENVDAGR